MAVLRLARIIVMRVALVAPVAPAAPDALSAVYELLCEAQPLDLSGHDPKARSNN